MIKVTRRAGNREKVIGSRNSRTRKRTLELDARQLNELLLTYQKMGSLLEQLVGRERMYRPEFLKGLDQSLRDVSAGKTKEVRTLDEFAA